MENKEILTESISDLLKNNFNDAIITDNKLCFIVDKDMYRVRMPNQGEQALVEHKRNLMQLEYGKQEGCVVKAKLIRDLKENNVVDIEQLNEEKEVLIKELKKYWFILATRDSEDEKKIAEYTEKINKIQNALQDVSVDISTYLIPCLQSRLEKFYLEYITVLCTEISVDNEWKRVWNTFEEFNLVDASLSNKAIANMTWLLLSRR